MCVRPIYTPFGLMSLTYHTGAFILRYFVLLPHLSTCGSRLHCIARRVQPSLPRVVSVIGYSVRPSVIVSPVDVVPNRILPHATFAASHITPDRFGNHSDTMITREDFRHTWSDHGEQIGNSAGQTIVNIIGSLTISDGKSRGIRHDFQNSKGSLHDRNRHNLILPAVVIPSPATAERWSFQARRRGTHGGQSTHKADVNCSV